MVFTSDLEEVEEVGCRCMDGDEVFVWLGGRSWERSDCKVIRALDIHIKKVYK